MDEKFWEQINTFGENGEFYKIVKEIKKLPEEKLNIELINALGRAYMNLGDYENALDTYLSYIGKNKEDVTNADIWIYSECGWLCNEVGDYERGLKYLLEAEKLGRDDEWVWARIANIYFDLERYEDALKAYNRAYELEGAYKEGKDSLYICSIGRTLRRLGRYEEAIEKLLESRRLSLEEGDVVDLEDLELAYCYAVLGNKEKAEEYMKLSIDSLGTYAESEEYLKKQFDEIREMINVLSHPS